MGLLKSAGDLAYTVRFLTLLVTPFEKTKAFKHGIIDENGKRLIKPPFDKIEDREAYDNYYTRFVRLVFNVKKLIAKAPGGSSRIASYAAALYLVKEDFGVSEKQIAKGLKEMGVDTKDFIQEQSTWYLLGDDEISPGVYKMVDTSIINETYDELVRKDDKIRIEEGAFPVGNILGLDVYEGIHMKSGRKISFVLNNITK